MKLSNLPFLSRLFLITGALITALLPAAAQNQSRLEFKADFAPSEGFVKAPEKPWRQELSLNGRWQFQPVTTPSGYQRDTGTPPALTAPIAAKWEKTPLKVPSPWNVNTWGNGRDAGDGTNRPYVSDSLYYPSYPALWDGIEMGWLRRSFTVPANWGTRRIVLHFEGVAGDAQILVNGRKAGEHFDSFTPFDLDITSLVKHGSPNELLVGVRKSNLFNRITPGHAPLPRTYPNGSYMDNLVGIWNDVSLLGLPEFRITDAFIKPNVDANMLEAEITVRNDTKQPQRLRVGGDVKPWVNGAGKDVLTAPVPKWSLGGTVGSFSVGEVMVRAGGSAKLRLWLRPKQKLKTWSPSAPNLYGAVFKVFPPPTSSTAKPPVFDTHYQRFGWRQFKIQGRDFLLNGQKIQLMGDFLHPFGPYIGSRRFVWQFYKMIKDMGGNATRPHGQLHPRLFLDLADEMGLCVLDEAAIFGSSINLNLKEDVTWTRFAKHVDDMVKRDRNHPSVFGWSPGNEMFAIFAQTSGEERVREVEQLKALA
ncbi:beta-galactosidase, partial [bacterium]